MRARKAGYPKEIKHGSVSVKVYRVKHKTTASGWAYVVAYTDTSGVRRLPQFANEEKALDEARLKAGQIASGRAEGADMSRADRDELSAARKLADVTPVLSALAEWKKIQDLTGGNGIAAAEAWAGRNSTRFASITVADAIDKFTAAKRAAGVDVTCSYNKIFPSLREHAEAQLMDSISSRALQSWLDSRYPHPVTRNTARKRIVALWRWSRKQGYLPRDVLTEAEQTDRVKEGTYKRGTITAATLQTLLSLIHRQHIKYLAPLVLATACGLRRAEVHAQSWDHIDLAARMLTVTKAKEGTPAERSVPIPRAAVSWLMLCPNRKGAVCDNLAIDRIRDIARTANIELPENAFRHSFITYRCKLVPVAQVADEAGNSPTMIRKHYRVVLSDSRPMRKAEAKDWFESSPSAEKALPIRIEAA